MTESTCSNCAHARELKLSLRDTALECREGPPLIGYAVGMGPNGQPAGIAPISIVPRIVPGGYSCDRFKARETAVQ